MPVPFPTGGGAHRATAPGHPTRASHCTCKRPMRFAGVDECLKCGKQPNEDIAQTWSDRARQIAARNRAIAAKASEKKQRRNDDPRLG